MTTETELSTSIRKALKLAGCWLIRIPAGGGRVRNGFIHAAEPGTPDLLIVKPYGWLEIKTDEGSLNKDQIAWHARAESEGLRVAVVRSVEMALRTVRKWKEQDEQNRARDVGP